MRKIEQSDFINWELRWRSGKESAYQCRRLRRRGFHPWVRKIPWHRKWQPTPVFLPGKIPWTKEPGGLKSMGSQKSRTRLNTHSTALWGGNTCPWPTFSCTRSSRHSGVIHGGKSSDNRSSPFLDVCYNVYRGAVTCDTLSCLQSYHGWFTCASTKAPSLTGTLDPIYLSRASLLPSYPPPPASSGFPLFLALSQQHRNTLLSVQSLSLCNPMDCSTPGFPVHHQLPKLAQTHVHWVGDAIQPSHPLSSPPLPAFNLSQHQSLFQEVSSLHQMAKVLEFQLQHQSFQWIFRTDFL